MAADMFLKLDGVTGESTDTTHKGECEVLSFSFGGSNSAQISSATTGAGSAGRVNLSDFSIMKRVDDASTTIFQKMCNGTHFNSAIVTVRKPGGTALEYLIYTFGECFITAFSQNGSDGGGDVTENISFAYTTISIKYTSQAASGGAGSPTTASWDLTTNKEEG